MSWLEVPVPLLAALAERLPRLQAEDSMRRATENAYGAGTMRDDDRKALWRSWRDEAGYTECLSTPQELLGLAAALRVPVERAAPNGSPSTEEASGDR